MSRRAPEEAGEPAGAPGSGSFPTPGLSGGDGQPRYRLLVVDLDGTVRSRRLGIPQGVREAVTAARAREVRVCLATGRMWRSAEPWVRVLGADAPAILYNGGQVFDFQAGRMLYERRLPGTTACVALDILRSDPGVQVHVYVNDRVYVERPHHLTDALMADDGLTCDVVPSLDALLTEDLHKILVVGSREQIEALQQAVAMAALPVHAVQSEPTYLEILPPGVTKGTALVAMLAVLGIAADETIAVGDNWNDLEMIEAAGLGVAMASAPPEVRARANYVCGTVEEEGVGEVIERFLLRSGNSAAAPTEPGAPMSPEAGPRRDRPTR